MTVDPSVFEGIGEASSSVDQMIAAAQASPDVGALPLLYMTSGVRDIPDPYHGTYNATDWGDNADQLAGSPQMDNFANWLQSFYGPWSLEIIHVNQAQPGQGNPEDQTTVEWKLGVHEPHGWYGWDTLLGDLATGADGHRGHVHWAITNNGLAAAAAWWKQIAALTGDQVDLPNVDATVTLDMDALPIRRLQGLLEANGLMLHTDNTDRGVLLEAIKRVQEINGWPQTGIADQAHVWNWALTSSPK